MRVFDSDRNDYCFTLLPITRSFTERELRKTPGVATHLTRSLSDWFEARDVPREDERLVVRELRQGVSADDSSLVDLAAGAEKRGDFDGAERLYRQAIARPAELKRRGYRLVRDCPGSTFLWKLMCGWVWVCQVIRGCCGGEGEADREPACSARSSIRDRASGTR